MSHGLKALLLWSGFALAIAMLFWFMHGSDPWKATVKMAGGTQEIVIERQNEIYYRVVLPETSGTKGTFTLKPNDVSAPGWTQTFYDGTVLPGRWTLKYGENELDLLPSTLYFNRKSHDKGSVIIQN